MYSYYNCILWLDGYENTDNLVTPLYTQWNFIGYPSFGATEKINLTVTLTNGTIYSWQQAVTNGIVIDSIYGWNATMQNYIAVNQIEEGSGYWLYSYQQCLLRKLIP